MQNASVQPLGKVSMGQQEVRITYRDMKYATMDKLHPHL